MMRLFIALTGFLFSFSLVNAQNVKEWNGQLPNQRTITTAVPFLNIGPDARSGGMGELGAATEPDAMSQHWNPAKFAFIEKEMGFGVSYSPWLRQLVNDINLAYLSFYRKIDDVSTVSASLKFFSLGDIIFTREDGSQIGTFRPSEFAVDAGYSRKFSPKVSGSVVARYIHSNLTQGQVDYSQPGTSFAADVAMYYTDELAVNWLESSDISFGAVISNIGQKISYSSTEFDTDFIPTNFRIGSSWLMGIDEYNSIRFSLDLNKLLVPSPPHRINDTIVAGEDDNVSVAQGMIQSFYDAPGGFSEELKEIVWVVGAEFWYDNQFAIRAGYFHESQMKGNRKFFTMGAGLRYNVFGLDFSYLIPTEQQNPLANTLRFTLTFDFDGFEEQ